MNQITKSMTKDSKLLSLVLRHAPEKVGLTLGDGGWVEVDAQTAIKVGQRHGKPVILKIDAAAMSEAGHVFYKADNGVWLTDSVPSDYIVWEPV